MKQVKDNFSSSSDGYQRFRPTYPSSLYEFIYSQCTAFDTALDCGTGNGQVALALSEQFGKVHATDISEQQLAQAPAQPNIEYAVRRAENTGFAANSFDLVTVGQAYHWFDFEAFGEEVLRILKPGGVIAVWSYDLIRFSPEIDVVFDNFYLNGIGPFWDDERKWVDDHYRSIPFPFAEVETDFRFEIHKEFTLTQLEGYIYTWSAVKHAIARTGKDPVPDLISEVKALWQAPIHQATFPGFLRLGKKDHF